MTSPDPVPGEFLASGPIDYAVIEFPQHEPTGEPFQELLNLIDTGVIRLLDLVFIRKQDDGTVLTLDWQEAAHGDPDIEVFDGAASGLLADEDLVEAANALEPNAAAAVLVWENTWAAPFASAVRRAGGQLVASGRIPVQAILAALDIKE
jgi:hypothetical protein